MSTTITARDKRSKEILRVTEQQQIFHRSCDLDVFSLLDKRLLSGVSSDVSPQICLNSPSALPQNVTASELSGRNSSVTLNELCIF